MPDLQQRQGLPAYVKLRFCVQGRRRSDRFRLGRRFVVRRLFRLELRGMRTLMKTALRLGTRGSQLALWQANWVKTALQRARPDLAIELITIKTQGDKILDVPLAKVGGKGLFIKEIEEALVDGRIDLAVHSMKDMPSDVPAGLVIGAVPQRENPSDVLVSIRFDRLEDLPPGAKIGTSSLRRSAQILHRRPDVDIVALRGNLDTRLRKLETTDLDAIILAAAGMLRLGKADRISEYLNEIQMLPAVGQGALCIEIRDQDPLTMPLVSILDHDDTHTAVIAERAFLKRLEGGCQVPLAAHARLIDGRLHINGLVAETDGSRILRAATEGPARQAEALGRRIAEELLNQGADDILERLQQHGG
jgi:hydroxymethylbilane synthase